MGHAVAVFYRRLVFLLFSEGDSSVMLWLRCRSSYSLLCSAIMCLGELDHIRAVHFH